MSDEQYYCPILSEEYRAEIIENYRFHFDNIQMIVEATGEPIEGNIFTADKSFEELECFHEKQRNLMSIAVCCNEIVEIGFNAGHSALMMLLSNPLCTLTCVDICEHKYTEPCFEYLASQFPERIKLIKGRSYSGPPPDLYHIDGCHEWKVANIDFYTCLGNSKDRTVIIFDDTHIRHLRDLWNGYIANKNVYQLKMLPVTIPGTWHAQTNGQEFGIVLKHSMAVLSGVLSQSHRDAIAFGTKGRELYCKKHGYSFYSDMDIYNGTHNAEWAKLKTIVKYMKHPAKYSYIVWLDPDSHVMNYETNLVDIVVQHSNDKDIMLCRDWQSVGTDVMFIRNNKWSLNFLEATIDRLENGRKGIIYRYKNNKVVRDHIHVLDLKYQGLCYAQEANYSPGDFILRFTGAWDDDTLHEKMLKHCPDIIRREIPQYE